MPKRSTRPRYRLPLPKDGPKRREGELLPFAEWLKRVPRNRLTIWLQGMLWHGKLAGTELYQAFLLEYYKDINMIPENNGRRRPPLVKVN